uniref:Major capsid protein L1 n=1 Tax=Eidolon bat papillomavirus TaxID=3141875 RepID=A0AAU7E3M5_9PAPI
MAVWLPAQNKFYLPPAPITRIYNTDEYVTRTDIFYHAGTERLLTVGNPFFEYTTGEDVTVPKVSPNQYRSFRVKLPDPNTFAFGDKSIYDPDRERLVWGLRGLEINRGGPLGVAVTGNPLTNRLGDVENPFAYQNGKPAESDTRSNVAFDVKQTQLFMVGCKPQYGEYWEQAKPCGDLQTGDCPPIQLESSYIEDGDMADIGVGNMNFKTLAASKSEAPLDVSQSIVKYPDFLQMAEDVYGDSLFFYARREQMYARHMFVRDGVEKEAIPEGAIVKPPSGSDHDPPGPFAYYVSPSGSLVSSESQLFNRPYWLQRAQGQNNGIIWLNELFLTVMDNTRGTHLNISRANTDPAPTGKLPSVPRTCLQRNQRTPIRTISSGLWTCLIG